MYPRTCIIQSFLSKINNFVIQNMDRILAVIGEILIEKYGTPVVKVVASEVHRSATTIVMEKLSSTVQVASQLPLPSILTNRTGLELAFIGSTLGVALWQGCRTGAFGALGRFSPKLVPGAAFVRRKFCKTTFSVDKPNNVTLESYREGSEESDMTPPKNQCKIGYWREGEFVVLGSALRFGLNLVMLDHVAGGDPQTSVEKFAYGKQGYLSLKGREPDILDTDLMRLKLTEAEFSKIGIATTIIKTVPENGSFASCVGPLGKGTAGNIRHDAQVFGRLVYSGTTKYGYSGSAYSMAGGMVGIHQTGGAINSGYDAGYVACLLAILDKEVSESSKQWLEAQYRAGRKIKWAYTGDPDSVQVRIAGKYTIVQRESLEQTFGRNWDTKDELYMQSADGYRDYESAQPSGEASPVVVFPGASTGTVEPRGSAQPNPQDLMNMYVSFSRQQRNAFRKLLHGSTAQQSIMSGPESQDQ